MDSSRSLLREAWLKERAVARKVASSGMMFRAVPP